MQHRNKKQMIFWPICYIFCATSSDVATKELESTISLATFPLTTPLPLAVDTLTI